VSYASPTLTWTGNLAVGAVATITYSVTVDNPDTGGGILANTVTSTTHGQQLRVRQHRSPVHVTVPVAQLLIVNQATCPRPRRAGCSASPPRSPIPARSPMTGSRSCPAPALVLAYATPDGDQTATSGTLTVTSTGLVWTGDIPVGGTVTITGTFTVDNPVPLNTVLTATITTTTRPAATARPAAPTRAARRASRC
jgi:hypothetical protein